MSAETRLDELLRHWEERHAQGVTLTPEEVCRDAPDLLEPFRRELTALRAADRVLRTKPVLVTATAQPGGGHQARSGGLEDVPLHPGAEPVPGYRLVTRLGQGGFGEVWKAVGPGGFPLALKFVRLAGPVGAAELRSLEILKGIRHPNLLSTVGAWEVGPRLIIAMELADRTLDDRLRAAKADGLPGIPGPELLEYLREAAKGIDFLNEPRHDIGGKSGVRLQHRDIKPANILLVGTGVKVADFGLVRLLEHSYASHSGALTPAYAAPEFFDGRTSPHSDQYSLGVTYCQLRGGRLPFTGSLMELMKGHVSSTPDLTMLPRAERRPVARALAKRPTDRWPDCRTFVEELAAAQARRPSRHLWMAAAVLVVVLAAGLLRLVPRPSSGAGWLPASLRSSSTVTPPKPVTISGGDVVDKFVGREEPNSGDATPPGTTGATVTGANSPTPSRAVPKVAARERVRFAGHQGAVRCVGWLPTSTLVLSGGDDGLVRSWDPRTGAPSRRLAGHQGKVTGLAVAPDGQHLLTGSEDKSVRYWDLPSGVEIWRRDLHEAPVHCVAISPDGQKGLSTGQDMTLRLWDLRDGREITRFETEVEYWSAAFTPDGRHIIAAGDSPIVIRLRLDTGQEAGRFAEHRDFVWSVACASGSDRAASGGGNDKGNRDDRVLVWTTTDAQPWRALEGHTGAVVAVAITRDGRRVLSGSADRTVRLWDYEAERELRCFRAHEGIVTCVAFAPDGARAASGGLDGAAYVWELP